MQIQRGSIFSLPAVPLFPLPSGKSPPEPMMNAIAMLQMLMYRRFQKRKPNAKSFFITISLPVTPTISSVMEKRRISPFGSLQGLLKGGLEDAVGMNHHYLGDSVSSTDPSFREPALLRFL